MDRGRALPAVSRYHRRGDEDGSPHAQTAQGQTRTEAMKKRTPPDPPPIPSDCAPCAAGGAIKGEHLPGCETVADEIMDAATYRGRSGKPHWSWPQAYAVMVIRPGVPDEPVLITLKKSDAEASAKSIRDMVGGAVPNLVISVSPVDVSIWRREEP